MAFIDIRLNDRYRFGFTGGPAWNTIKFDLMSGRTRRKKGWSMPHYKFSANYAALSEAEKDALLAAFMVAGGSFAAFRFKDYNDFRAVNEPLGTGDGTSTPIQLAKTYRFGPAAFTRTIRLPLNAVVYANGAPLAGVMVDPLTGLATPSGTWPSGALLTWSGEFDVRVRFANDYNPFTAVATGIRECAVELEEDLG